MKAMVTGAVPGFIDVVMNLASTELKEDNILLKMNQMGKKINFFGDDTWLKLFPNCFMRHDGTTSFVVSDYKEVSGLNTNLKKPICQGGILAIYDM